MKEGCDDAFKDESDLQGHGCCFHGDGLFQGNIGHPDSNHPTIVHVLQISGVSTQGEDITRMILA
jgi:hypothetical protein